jgi:hypothetical protein
MSVLARLRSFLPALVFRRRMERDMVQEWQFHLDARTEDLFAGGIPRAEAEARARREFGRERQDFINPSYLVAAFPSGLYNHATYGDVTA